MPDLHHDMSLLLSAWRYTDSQRGCYDMQCYIKLRVKIWLGRMPKTRSSVRETRHHVLELELELPRISVYFRLCLQTMLTSRTSFGLGLSLSSMIDSSVHEKHIVN